MKAVLLGRDNPRSLDPRYALYPRPRGCAGHRLYETLREVSGASLTDYRDGFDRRNLVTGPWSREAGRRAAEGFTPPQEGTIVVVLGQDVARALSLAPTLIDPQERDGRIYRVVPHPSGRNPWYNEPMNRLVVGLLLEELLCPK